MPAFFSLYYVVQADWRNGSILAASLLFCFVGAPGRLTDPIILGCAEFRLQPCSVCQTELDKGKGEPTTSARRADTPRKRYKPEEIVAKLRQVDVPVSQEQTPAEAIRQIDVSEVTYYRTVEGA